MSDLVRSAWRELQAITARLRAACPHRSFPLDGMLVGDIGELLVSQRYGLRPLGQSSKGHDCIAPDGRRVEVKATGTGGPFALRPDVPDHLIAIRIRPDGTDIEIYNGPGAPVWEAVAHRKTGSSGQRTISISRLRELDQQVPPQCRLRPVAVGDE